MALASPARGLQIKPISPTAASQSASTSVARSVPDTRACRPNRERGRRRAGVAARPREREPGALAVVADQGDGKHPGDSRNRGGAIVRRPRRGLFLSSQCASAAGFRNLQPVVREKTAGLGPVRP
jgi:hypothetical protein